MKSSENSGRTAGPHSDRRRADARAKILPLSENEIERGLFATFSRRQEVKKCLRNVGGNWTETEEPFIDDWSEEDYTFLAECLRRTVRLGGIVFGAFIGGALKGFASVEAKPCGKAGDCRELTSIHVSEELRGRGIGRELFVCAKEWAKAQGAKKLYISSHPAVESQAFYAAMHCTDARESDEERAARGPFDRRLECTL